MNPFQFITYHIVVPFQFKMRLKMLLALVTSSLLATALADHRKGKSGEGIYNLFGFVWGL